MNIVCIKNPHACRREGEGDESDSARFSCFRIAESYRSLVSWRHRRFSLVDRGARRGSRQGVPSLPYPFLAGKRAICAPDVYLSLGGLEVDLVAGCETDARTKRARAKLAAVKGHFCPSFSQKGQGNGPTQTGGDPRVGFRELVHFRADGHSGRARYVLVTCSEINATSP